MRDYQLHQEKRRAALYAAHQGTIDRWWGDDGSFIYHTEGTEGYRVLLWHCLAYLAGDAHCIAKANRIIVTNRKETPDHFTPGAAIDLLWHHRAVLEDDARDTLERYLQLNLQYMSTPDLQVWGYNDNHPYKAFHALIVGGEMFDLPDYVELGVQRLRDAVELCERNGFPCEYNSPTYTPVSLQPLASIAEQAQHAEARELAVTLQRFYWQDLALHYDPRAGVPAGPHSRAYVDGYSGLLSSITQLLLHLFPERFDLDLMHEHYKRDEPSELFDPAMRPAYPRLTARVVWFARPNYHLTEEIERAIFEKPAGTYVRGQAETGSWSINWQPEQRPEGAPSTLHLGPRRSLCTTYFGKQYTLGTAQYSWLDNGQHDGFYATVARGDGRNVKEAAVYFSRMFFDERSPYGESPCPSHCFRDDGDIRTVQHHNTALVCYNPHPLFGTFKRLRVGIFRPLLFSTPEELWVGNTPVPGLNYMSGTMEPVAIRDGQVYIGFIPLRLTDCGQARQAHLHVQTYSDRLSILLSSFEGWAPRAFRFEDIMNINAGFICEVRDADEFSSFTDFRAWLAAVRVEDTYDLSFRRKLVYRRDGLTISARYSPYQTGFQHVTVNRQPLEQPLYALEGIADPGYTLARSAKASV